MALITPDELLEYYVKKHQNEVLEVVVQELNNALMEGNAMIRYVEFEVNINSFETEDDYSYVVGELVKMLKESEYGVEVAYGRNMVDYPTVTRFKVRLCGH